MGNIFFPPAPNKRSSAAGWLAGSGSPRAGHYLQTAETNWMNVGLAVAHTCTIGAPSGADVRAPFYFL